MLLQQPTMLLQNGRSSGIRPQAAPIAEQYQALGVMPVSAWIVELAPAPRATGCA